MHIRSGPVRALFPKTNSKRSFINLSTLITPRRQSYSHPRFALPSNALRSAMNNYWMTNKTMKPTSVNINTRQAAPLRRNFSVFATTPWISSGCPAYAPASVSILFPAFRFAAERRGSLVRLRSLLVHQ
jgi:hypothetical protein